MREALGVPRLACVLSPTAGALLVAHICPAAQRNLTSVFTSAFSLRGGGDCVLCFVQHAAAGVSQDASFARTNETIAPRPMSIPASERRLILATVGDCTCAYKRERTQVPEAD